MHLFLLVVSALHLFLNQLIIHYDYVAYFIFKKFPACLGENKSIPTPVPACLPLNLMTHILVTRRGY